MDHIYPPALSDCPDNRFPGFASFKTDGNIQYQRRCARDLLIQLTLDPTFSAISSMKAPSRIFSGLIFECVASGHGADYLIGLCEFDERIITAPSARFKVAIAVPRRMVLDCGWADFARMIWSRRRFLVQPRFQAMVLKTLSEVRGAVSFDALEQWSGGDPDWVDWILAMAARGLVTIGRAENLTHKTLVTLGPTGESVDNSNPSVLLGRLDP